MWKHCDTVLLGVVEEIAGENYLIIFNPLSTNVETFDVRRTVSRHVFKKQKFEFLNFVFHFIELIVNNRPT